MENDNTINGKLSPGNQHDKDKDLDGKDDEDDDTAIRPFEWLTSAESLQSIISPFIWGDDDKDNDKDEAPQQKVILHVGCGSSRVGECLLECDELRQDGSTSSKIAKVINVDNDSKILQAMERRWQQQKHWCNRDGDTDNMVHKLQFMNVDIVQQDIPLPEESCHVVIDKSTLDCLLCSDAGAAKLISQVYRLLHPTRGIYILISFHNINYLLSMLQKCPGTQWTFTHSIMYRHVESLMTPPREGNSKDDGTTTTTITNLAHVEIPSNHLPQQEQGNSWSTNGIFQPDEIYHRTVNVLIGRKHHFSSSSSLLDMEAVCEHINQCSHEWYQTHNPMLTETRTLQIRHDFDNHRAESNENGGLVSLEQCYDILFTPEEQEHLTYAAFLEDWEIFLQNHPDLAIASSNAMSCDTALLFLSEMQ